VRRILLLALGISVGLGILLSGCRESDDAATTSAAKPAADTPQATAEADEGALGLEADALVADEVAEANAVEASGASAPESGNEQALMPESEHGIFRAEALGDAGARVAQQDAAVAATRPELALAELEDDMPLPAAAEETATTARPESAESGEKKDPPAPASSPADEEKSQAWLAARSREILEHEAQAVRQEAAAPAREDDIWSRSAPSQTPLPPAAPTRDLSAMAAPAPASLPPLPPFEAPELADDVLPRPPPAPRVVAAKPQPAEVEIEVPPLTVAETEPEAPVPAILPPVEPRPVANPGEHALAP